MRQAALQLLLLFSICLCALGQGPNRAADPSGTRPCSLLPLDKTHPPTSTDLFRAYDAQVQLIRTLNLIGVMRGKSGDTRKQPAKPLEMGVIVDLVAPNLLHITGVAPYQGNRQVELTSDGERFGLLVPEDGRKVYLTGPVDSAGLSEKIQENFRPRTFLDSLRWQPGTPRAEVRPAANTLLHTRTLTVDIAPAAETPTRRIDVVFDLDKGVVDSLTAYDHAGTALLTTLYSDWRTSTIASSGVPSECYARRIVLVQPQQDYQLEFRVSALTLNAPISKSNFRVIPPRGVPVEQVNLLGDRTTH